MQPRPPARMTQLECFNPHPSRRTGATGKQYGALIGEIHVSILTRPGGRVQLKEENEDDSTGRFQSSPVPEDGCNEHARQYHDSGLPFQSSPVPEDGCNESQEEANENFEFVSILTRPGGRVQLHRRGGDSRLPREFQSSPVPEDGCNYALIIRMVGNLRFNPHPSRRTGATNNRRCACA